MPVTIAVGVTPGVVKATSRAGRPSNRFNRSFEYDGLGDAYARFVLDELLPEVEKKTAPDGRADQALEATATTARSAAPAAGPIAAFTAAWERPDAFRRVFSTIGTYVGLRGRQRLPDPDPQGRAQADPGLSSRDGSATT